MVIELEFLVTNEFEYLLLCDTWEAGILRLLLSNDFGSILTIFMLIESDFRNVGGLTEWGDQFFDENRTLKVW